jgi:tetratricopeptide (TPR) repeat protein
LEAYQAARDVQARLLGDDHPEEAQTLTRLAALYIQMGRYFDAGPLLKRALELREAAIGPSHFYVAKGLEELANIYVLLARYAEAEAALRRSLAIHESILGGGDPEVAGSLNGLGRLLHAQGRFAESEPLIKHALELLEKAWGAEHPAVAASLDNLGDLYRKQARLVEAEPLFKRALAIREKALGVGHADVASSLNNLANLYEAEGRYDDAEPLYKRSLAIRENVFGVDHPEVTGSLSSLARLYEDKFQYSEAEGKVRRAIAIREKALGPDHPDVAASLYDLASLYRATGRIEEAAALAKRALDIREKSFGEMHPDVASSLNLLGGIEKDAGKIAEAEALVKQAIGLREKIFGSSHPHFAASLAELASIYEIQHRYAEGQSLAKRSLEIRERVYGDDHPEAASWLNSVAALDFAEAQWTEAAEIWRRATRIAQRKKNDSPDSARSAPIRALVKAIERLPGGVDDSAAVNETFQLAQMANESDAGQSLVQMAARGAKRDDPRLAARVAALVRERQDLISQWQRLDSLRIESIARPVANRQAQAEAENNSKLSAIDSRVAEIDKELKASFPDFAALASPNSLPVEEVQGLLRADEALVVFLDTKELQPTPEETFVWVVTKTAVRWEHSNFGTSALSNQVRTLRCGLDRSAWDNSAVCRELTGQDYNLHDWDAGRRLPFDHARAYRLYKELFGQAEDLIKEKQLLIVPAGALTQLPLQVLVTEPPADNDNKHATWLIREHALTVLPSVYSLKALRRIARPSAASKPMIGFGNPLVEGVLNDPNYGAFYSRQAQLARETQHCPSSQLRNLLPRAVFRGGLADITFLRMQPPIPETADELCAVAHDLGADPGEVRLGARATEAEVKRLSVSGELAQYRVVHFATHLALPGEVMGIAEPGLVLTPPAEASHEDDGFLSATEIAGLRLDADLVILSGCNAAKGSNGKQALSGLPRAFFYAGARSVIAAHLGSGLGGNR